MILEKYAKEFIKITDALLTRLDKPEPCEYALIKENYLYVDKEKLIEILGKYPFDTAENKLKFWRGVNWIKCDKEHFTGKITVNGKQIRRVIIDFSVVEHLKTAIFKAD